MNKQTEVKQQVGVWINHREAFVVFSHDENIESQAIAARMEKHVRYATHTDITGNLPEGGQERRLSTHLDRYYDEIIEHIKNATAILICGPGEAKGEFKKRLESRSPSKRVVGFETTAKLTNQQMVTKIQTYFHPLGIH